MPLHGHPDPAFHNRGLPDLPLSGLVSAVTSIADLNPLLSTLVPHIVHTLAPPTHTSAPPAPPTTIAVSSSASISNPSKTPPNPITTSIASNPSASAPPSSPPSAPSTAPFSTTLSQPLPSADPSQSHPSNPVVAQTSQNNNQIQNAAVAPSPSDHVQTSLIPLTLTTTLTDGSVLTFTTTSQSIFTPRPSTDPPSTNDPAGDPVNGPQHKKFPTWAIGVVSTFLFVFLSVALLILARRHQRNKRAQRRARWAPSMIQQPLASARSSFATHFDHGDSPINAESVPRLPSPPLLAATRLSNASDAQFVLFDRPLSQELAGTDDPLKPLPSPMSVRPFSPTESYKFPRPPSQSATSLATHSTASTLSTAINPSFPAQGPSPGPLGGDPSLTKSKLLVKRPFAPALEDELVVLAGDHVRINDVFDDGWALAQKADGTIGLLPLACFEENDSDVDVPAFMVAHKWPSGIYHVSDNFRLAH